MAGAGRPCWQLVRVEVARTALAQLVVSSPLAVTEAVARCRALRIRHLLGRGWLGREGSRRRRMRGWGGKRWRDRTSAINVMAQVVAAIAASVSAVDVLPVLTEKSASAAMLHPDDLQASASTVSTVARYERGKRDDGWIDTSEICESAAHVRSREAAELPVVLRSCFARSTLWDASCQQEISRR